MATKKDLVEAYSFSRRRLITAFVSGAPGGREVEPNRPGRTIVGGVALAILLVAGAAVLGILKSPTMVDFTQEDLISEKELGADYVVLPAFEGSDEIVLRPVVNITSAMLLFGSDVDSLEVPRDKIAEETPGEPIGILDAPATPPDESELIQTGWTACTGQVDGDPVGIRLDVSEETEAVPMPDAGFVVRTADGRLFLVSESSVGTERGTPRAYAYPVPENGVTDRILQNVAGTNSDNAVTVPDAWITLFPPGGALALETFGLQRADLRRPSEAAATVGGAEGAEVGDLLVVGLDRYLLTRDGVLRLDAFSTAVYSNLSFPRKDPLATFDAAQAPSGDIPDVSGLPNTSWPSETHTARPAGQLCALLDTPGGQPGVVLATAADDSAASGDGVSADDVEVGVDSGHGAFVLSGSWDDAGPSRPFLVDDRGYQYAVGSGDERGNLGYGETDDIVVPDQWVELFDDGVPLTIDAARCPPTSDPDPSSCS